MAKQKTNSNHNPYRPNIWYMLMSIINTSINRGQLLLMSLFLVLVFFLYRLPPADLKPVFYSTLYSLEHGYLLGWFLFALTSIIFFFVNRSLRKGFATEYKRIGEEKSMLQNKLIGGHEVESSN